MSKHELSQDNVQFTGSTHNGNYGNMDTNLNKSIESAYSVPSDLE